MHNTPHVFRSLTSCTNRQIAYVSAFFLVFTTEMLFLFVNKFPYGRLIYVGGNIKTAEEKTDGTEE